VGHGASVAAAPLGSPVSMDDRRYSRLHELFERAREAPPEERAAVLAEASPEDAAEVEALLAAERAAPTGDALSEAAIDAQRARLAEVVDAAEVGAALPDRVGPYRIVGRLGVGGMGVVYAAEQSSPRRTVALKVVHPGFASRSREARFRREAELLGRLQHPGIARIYEAGDFDLGHGAQPYFAMELVEGHTLVAHAVLRKLTVPQRLELMAKVADAIEHAHQQGVLHRDLKPDNVLVDRDGQPKVLDFGVARPMDALDSLAMTVTGDGELVGTLAYMAPEQCTGSADSVGPHSDVYALGVMLYELLTGRTPLRTAGLSLTQAMTMLAREDPPRPSALDPQLAGDVETIVLAALEKEPRRRYPSAAALADDLRRHLQDRPIQARAPSATYRALKFVKRHRSLVATLVVLVLGLAGTLTFAALTASRSRALGAANDELAHALYTSETRQVSLVATQPGSGALLRRYVAQWRDKPLPPGTRGLEFRLLQRLAEPAQKRVSVGQRAMRAAWTPDGTRLAVATVDGPIVLDGRTLQEVARCRAVRGFVFDVAWDPSGERIAFTTHFDGLFVWDVASDAIVWSTGRSDTDTNGVEWHPTGDTIVSTTFVGALRVHNAATGALITRIERACVGDAPTLSVGRSGRVAVVGPDQHVHFHEWPIGSKLPLAVAHVAGDSIDGLSFAPNGDDIAFALRSGRVGVVARGASVPRLSEVLHTDKITSVAWNRTGTSLTTASSDFSAMVVDAGVLRPVARLVGQGAQLDWAQFDADGTSVLTGGTEPWVERWELARLGAVRRGWVLPRHGGTAVQSRVQPGGGRIASLLQGRITAWVPAAPPRFTAVPETAQRITHFDWSPSGDELAVARGDRLTLEAVDGSNVRAEWVFPELLRALAFGPPGSDRLYFHTSHELWSLEPRAGAAPVWRFDVHDSTSTLLASRDGRAVVFGGITLGLVRLDSTSFQPTATNRALHSAQCVAESPDGAALVVGLLGHRAYVVAAEDLTERLSLEGHTAAVTGAAWSPDGSRIVTVGADGKLLVWDAADGDLVAQLEHGEPLADVVFTADGAGLVVLASSGSVWVWDVE
jgi:WD40 repeat protein